MTRIRKTLLFVTSVIALALIVFPVFAQVAPLTGNCTFLGSGQCSGSETFADLVSSTSLVIEIINVVILLMRTLTFAFLVIAAIQYVTSQGDPEKAEKAKKQVTYALLGLILAWSAGILVDLILDPTSLATRTPVENRIIVYIDLAIYFIGLIAAVFLIVASIQYITSGGDTEKAEKAKKGIIYALLGLILASVAWFIVNVILAPASQEAITAVEDIFLVYINLALNFIGLIAAIFIIYAGFKYIISQGDQEASATAKRQILFALLGVFIAGTAWIIIDVVGIQDPALLIIEIRDVVNAVLSILGLIAAAYVILGGVMYLMSEGDQDKASRAKMQIIYALLGIFVIAVSAIFVNFIIANI